MPIRQTGHYEFRSPTFRRLGATADLPSNAGGASIQVQQQQQHPNHPSSPSLQQVMALINQPPPPIPLPSQADAIAELISNFQRSSQQPSIPSQQSVLNQNSNQPNNTDATGILQSIAGSSIQMQQQQPNQASSLLQVMAQINQPPPPNPPPSQADAIADLISSILRQRSSQQPSIPSQQSVLNQNNNQQKNTDATGILQSIVGSNQQPLLSSHSTPGQQPVPNQPNQLSNVDANNHLQPFQQWSQPNPTLNHLLNTAPSILAGSQAPSAQLMGYSSTSSRSDAIHALMSLYGMMLPQLTLPNTNTSAPMSRLLVLLMHRVAEEELQRRVQVDAIHEAIIATIGQIVGGNNVIDEAERQRRLVAALGQTLGNTGETNTSNVPLSNPSGMTVRVPHNTAAHSQQVGTPPSPGGNLDIQAASIAAILQAAAVGQLEEDALAQNNGPDNSVDGAGNDEYKVNGPFSPRKRKSPDEYQYEDGNDS